jgi:hypothetical protein
MRTNLIFVPNPYVQGGSMREDVFSVQLSVYVDLEVRLLDNDRVSTYSQSSSLFIGGASTVGDAVDLAGKYMEQHCSDSAMDQDSREFTSSEEDSLEWTSLRSFRIYDREDRFIMGGIASGDAVSWIEPVTAGAERAEVEAQIEALLSKASNEAGWDNYSTAANLRQAAERLSWKLSPSPIVRSAFFTQETTQKGVFAKP